MENLSSAQIDAVTTVTSALGSPLRIRIILLLRDRDHVVHELVRALNQSQPLISQHLRVLKRAGIVESERTGREVTYRLSRPEVVGLLIEALKISRV